jgi:hypothetical protein
VSNRKENVHLIIAINAQSRPVYTNGAPALLNASLSRLKNIVKDQVLHVTEAAYGAAKAVTAHEYLIHPLNPVVDIKSQVAEAWHYDNASDSKLEIEHWLIDFPGNSVNLFDHGKDSFVNRGFISHLHVAEYFGMPTPPEVDFVGEGRLSEELLAHSGYLIERTDWETLPDRQGGPTCARIRYRTYRHNAVAKLYPTVLSVDDSARAVEAAKRTHRDNIARNPVPVVKQVVDPNPPKPVKRDDVDEFTGLRKPSWRVG